MKKENTVLKPTLVDLLNKLRLRENHVEGTRQITSVTSEKGGHGTFFVSRFLFLTKKSLMWHKRGGGDCLLKTQDSAKW